MGSFAFSLLEDAQSGQSRADRIKRGRCLQCKKKFTLYACWACVCVLECPGSRHGAKYSAKYLITIPSTTFSYLSTSTSTCLSSFYVFKYKHKYYCMYLSKYKYKYITINSFLITA